MARRFAPWPPRGRGRPWGGPAPARVPAERRLPVRRHRRPRGRARRLYQLGRHRVPGRALSRRPARADGVLDVGARQGHGVDDAAALALAAQARDDRVEHAGRRGARCRRRGRWLRHGRGDRRVHRRRARRRLRRCHRCLRARHGSHSPPARRRPARRRAHPVRARRVRLSHDCARRRGVDAGRLSVWPARLAALRGARCPGRGHRRRRRWRHVAAGERTVGRNGSRLHRARVHVARRRRPRPAALRRHDGVAEPARRRRDPRCWLHPADLEDLRPHRRRDLAAGPVRRLRAQPGGDHRRHLPGPGSACRSRQAMGRGGGVRHRLLRRRRLRCRRGRRACRLPARVRCRHRRAGAARHHRQRPGRRRGRPEAPGGRAHHLPRHALGVTLAGIGSAFWGIVAGGLALVVQQWRPRPPASGSSA